LRASELLKDAAVGSGRLLVFEGPAGIGKTALLERTCKLAEQAGFLVLRARGGELEREFPHGVVRQLLDAHIRSLSEEEKASYFEGAAQLAMPALVGGSVPEDEGPGSDSSFAVTHGLYWLVANIADHTPLVVAVDDLQWSDASSLRFVSHLARRLEGMPVLLTACIRTGEPSVPDEVLARVTSEPEAEVLQPAPLSEAAVASMLEIRLGEKPAAEFAAACYRATGGVPFLVSELMSTLAVGGVRPTADAVDDVTVHGSRAVARAVSEALATEAA